VDLLRLGATMRAVRRRVGWRQRDVAHRAGVSAATISRMERGHAGSFAVDTLTRVAGVLEIQLDIIPRWRGGELDRMMGARHGRLHAQVARYLAQRGWEFVSEATFAVYGERGSIDALAMHRSSGSVLVVELKTQLVDVQGLLTAVDRYRRLAPRLATERGWDARTVSVWVAMHDTRTNRRRVALHRAVLRAAFPHDGRRVGSWLRSPVGTISALSFLPDVHPGTLNASAGGAQRVRPRLASVARRRVPASGSADATLAGPAASDRA
jgi:transcriptional regulator with XRE-family HTH domain